MKLARENGLVPKEIYSEKGKTPEDAILQQVLVYDIARQLRRPLLVALVDVAQCYNRIAHAVASLTLRAYKVRQTSVASMLTPIQSMEYYFRTGFGELRPTQEEKMIRNNARAKATQRHHQHGNRLIHC